MLPREVVGIAPVVNNCEWKMLFCRRGWQTLAPPDSPPGQVFALRYGAHGGVGFHDHANAFRWDGPARKRDALNALALRGPWLDGWRDSRPTAFIEQGVRRFECSGFRTEGRNAFRLSAPFYVGGAHILDPNARVSAAVDPAVLQSAHRCIGHGGSFDDGWIVYSRSGPRI